MPQVDQFESVFRSAIRDVFHHADPGIHSVLVVTDLDAAGAAAFTEKVKVFAAVLGESEDQSWTMVTGDQFRTTEELQILIEKESPDLICSYRNLHSRAWRFPHSLGEHLDIIVQQVPMPVLVVPHPEAGRAYEHALENTNVVMAATDHLSNDHALVNYAVKFTEEKGKLFLMHIEDDAVFERYLEAISKIPTIDTEEARASLALQLLKQPRDYVNSCVAVLREAGVPIELKCIVEFGHHLKQYRQHIEKESADLLVMHSKDEDQLAMHGLAYPLAIELREIPILMI